MVADGYVALPGGVRGSGNHQDPQQPKAALQYRLGDDESRSAFEHRPAGEAFADVEPLGRPPPEEPSSLGEFEHLPVGAEQQHVGGVDAEFGRHPVEDDVEGHTEVEARGDHHVDGPQRTPSAGGLI